MVWSQSRTNTIPGHKKIGSSGLSSLSQYPTPMQTDNNRNDSPWMRLSHYRPKDQSVNGLHLRQKDISAHQDTETMLHTANNLLQKKLWVTCRSCRSWISFKISQRWQKRYTAHIHMRVNEMAPRPHLPSRSFQRSCCPITSSTPMKFDTAWNSNQPIISAWKSG